MVAGEKRKALPSQDARNVHFEEPDTHLAIRYSGHSTLGNRERATEGFGWTILVPTNDYEANVWAWEVVMIRNCAGLIEGDVAAYMTKRTGAQTELNGNEAITQTKRTPKGKTSPASLSRGNS